MPRNTVPSKTPLESFSSPPDEERTAATSPMVSPGPRHAERLSSSHATQSRPSALAIERLNASTEVPVVVHLPACSDAREEGDDGAQDSPFTALPTDPSLQLDNVILDTLLWMSGMSRSMRASEGLSETEGLKLLQNDAEDTPAEATSRTASIERPHDTLHTTPAVSTGQSGSSQSALSLPPARRGNDDEHTDASQQQQQQLRTPMQRRIPALFTDPQNSNGDYLNTATGMGDAVTSLSGGIPPTGSAGLVSTTHPSPGADVVSRSPTSNESADPRTTQSALSKARVRRTEQLGGMGIVRGLQWQEEFTAHAQQILRETHKQVEVLREYQAKAARETQRADRLAEARRTLEKRLAAAEQLRLAEEEEHKTTVGELSRQVLEQDEVIGSLRRMQVAWEDQLEEARRAAKAQKAAHEAEIDVLARRHESQLEALRVEHRQREEKWKLEHERLLLLLPEQRQCASTKTDADELESSLASPSGTDRAASASRVDAATKTEAAGKLSSSNGSTHGPGLFEMPSDQTPYERIHPEALARQQLREEMLMSQLSLLEGRLQHEVEQRRQSEQQVMDLLVQNEDLREVAARVAAPASKAVKDSQAQQVQLATAELLAEAEREASAIESAVRDRAAAIQQQQMLHEIQKEYEVLQRESTALRRHTAQQRQHVAQWAAIRSHLLPLLELAGMEPDMLTAEAVHPRDVAATLDALFASLKEQKRANIMNNALEREAVRLASLEQALQQADQQNSMHQATLEVTEAQLREARNELAQWQQRQQEILRRQQQHEEAWRTAEVHFKSVMAMLQRALRAYAQPPSHTRADDGDYLLAASSAASSEAEVKASKTKKCPLTESLAGLQKSSEAAVVESSATSSHRLEDSSNASSPADLEGSLKEAPAAVAKEVREHTGPAPSVVTLSKTEEAAVSEMSEALVGCEDSDARNGPALPASTMTVTATVMATVDALADGAPLLASNLENNMNSLKRSVRKLLTAWRTRQQALLENQKHWKQKAEEALSSHAALQAMHRSQEKRQKQQVRMLQSAEQHRIQELEALKREWAAALEQQTAKHALDLKHVHNAATREREALLGQIGAAEKKAREGDRALAVANEDCRTLEATVAQLQEEQVNAVKEHEQAQRRQSDLNIHIEDLEARLRETQQATVGMHALLTASVSAMVRLMLALHQLRQHYTVLHALRGNAEYAIRAVEHILSAANAQGYAGGADAWMASPLPPKSASHIWLSSLVASPSASAVLLPGSRLRAAVHAAVAVRRMQQLRQLSLKSGLSAATPPPLAPTLSSYRSLNSALVSYGIPIPALVTADVGSAVRGDFVLPAVRLPHTQDLVAPILPLLAPSRQVKKVHFDYRGDGEGSQGNATCLQAGSRAAAATVKQSLLEHLLSVTQLDVYAPSTPFLLAGVKAATNVGTLFHHIAKQAPWRRSALYNAKEQHSASAAALLNCASSSLPPSLAEPLQHLLSSASSQARQLVEVKAVVQKLVEQNQKLVSAVETQAQLDETRALEMDSMAVQLSLRRPQEQELVSLQERLVQSRSSLLQERQLRREAEAQLAQLRQQQLQWIGEGEHLKREVYALNMELANSSAAAHGPSILTLQRGEDTVVESATEILEIAAHADAKLRTPHQRSAHSHLHDDGSLRTAQKKVMETRSASGYDDDSYYRQLLRGMGEGTIGREKSSRAALRYQPRHNIPTSEELTQLLRASPHKKLAGMTCKLNTQGHQRPLCGASNTSPGYVSQSENLELFVPTVALEQQRQGHKAPSAWSTAVEDAASGCQDAVWSGAHTGNSGPATSASREASAHAVSAPSQTKHRKHSNANSVNQAIAESVALSPPPLQTDLSIHTATSVSTPPTAQIQPQQQRRPSCLSSAKGEDLPHEQRFPHAQLAMRNCGNMQEKQPSMPLAKTWAPSNSSPLSSILSEQPRYAAPSAPHSATAASAESHLRKFVASREGSERSVTQPPPAVRLSLSGHGPLSPTTISSSLPRSEAKQEAPSYSTRGPTYFTSRPA